MTVTNIPMLPANADTIVVSFAVWANSPIGLKAWKLDNLARFHFLLLLESILLV
jgi:hypothetical protein